MDQSNERRSSPKLWLILGIVVLLTALGFWPHLLAAPCLVASGIFLTWSGIGWHPGRRASLPSHHPATASVPAEASPSKPPPSKTLDTTGLRRDLVANVSHELKTPLTAIRGYAESLHDGALDQPEVARRFTGQILEQCSRLEDLLRDLLTLSWLESDRASKKHQAVDLEALLHSTVDLLAPRAARQAVEFIFDVEAKCPHGIGNADELERMLLNLLENAIKYNRPGGTVRLGLRAAEEQLVLDVEDTGIGIPADALDRVFERFYRVDKGRSRDQGGTGLGLAIVKHVVREHGGEIEVKSRLGEGSRFRIFLPCFPIVVVEREPWQ